ncbi:MAG TPA: DUF58 domain-containing protein [Treponemataceae bacterium]|nr:DUF58 domain-containing protein [Treponemataceae bacterium]
MKPGFSFRVSGQAVIALAASCGLLAEGLARGELVALILGLAIPIYILLSTIAIIATAARWSLPRVDPAVHRVAPQAFTAMPPALGPKRFPWRAPGASVFLRERFTVSSKDRAARHVDLLIPLSRSEGHAEIAQPERGIYRSISRDLVIADSADFLSIAIPLPQNPDAGTVVSPPDPADWRPRQLRPRDDEVSRGVSTTRRADTLFDVRPYFPGDDPRHINWKAYAHTGELMTRQGELLPPPSERYALIVNPRVDRKPSLATCRSFDGLIARVVGLAQELLRARVPFSLFTDTSAKSSFAYDGEGSLEALQAVREALALPQPERGEPFLPSAFALGGVRLVYFTLPPTTELGRKALTNALAPRADALIVFLGPHSTKRSDETARTLRSYIARAFFLPVEAAPPEEPLYPEAALLAATALSREGIDAYDC